MSHYHTLASLTHTALTRSVTLDCHSAHYLGILWKDYSCVVSNLAKFTVVTELLIPWLAQQVPVVGRPICLPLSTTDNSFPTASYSRGYRPSIKVISPPVCVSEPGYLLISRPEIVGQGGRAGSAGLTDGAWRGGIPAPPAPRPSSSGHGFRHRHRGGEKQEPGTAPF